MLLRRWIFSTASKLPFLQKNPHLVSIFNLHHLHSVTRLQTSISTSSPTIRFCTTFTLILQPLSAEFRNPQCDTEAIKTQKSWIRRRERYESVRSINSYLLSIRVSNWASELCKSWPNHRALMRSEWFRNPTHRRVHLSSELDLAAEFRCDKEKRGYNLIQAHPFQFIIIDGATASKSLQTGEFFPCSILVFVSISFLFRCVEDDKSR